MSVERVQEEIGFSLRWTTFPLHPETPDEGRLLSDLFSADPAYITSMWPRLEAAARELGVPFNPRTHTYNSRRASELAKWAEDKGKGFPFHRAVYEAYFARGENIGNPAVLETLAEGVGLDPAAVRGVLDRGDYRGAVDGDWRRCRQMGITAVPTINTNARRLVGFYPPQSLLDSFRGVE